MESSASAETDLPHILKGAVSEVGMAETRARVVGEVVDGRMDSHW